MTAEDFMSRLELVRPRGVGRWSARCPAHADRSPSLSIREAGTRILVRCFAGCESSQITAAIGLTMADLFTDTKTRPTRRPTYPSPRIDLDLIAFKFEL